MFAFGFRWRIREGGERTTERRGDVSRLHRTLNIRGFGTALLRKLCYIIYHFIYTVNDKIAIHVLNANLKELRSGVFISGFAWVWSAL